MKTAPSSARLLPGLLLLGAALGCASAPARPAAPEPRGPRGPRAVQSAAPAPAPAPETSPRAQRLFTEAVAAEQEFRRLKVPADWAVLERRWRDVLDAAEIPEARYNLGVALEAQGRAREARDAYARALADKPSLRQAAVNMGVLREKGGDVQGAQAAYAAIARDFPEDARSRERLAALYLAAGQVDEAWRYAREALLRDSRSIGAYKVLTRVALQRNQLDLARLIVLKAQKLAEADPEVPFLAGQIDAKQGDDVAATGQWRKALGQDDHYLPARYAILQAAVKKQAWTTVAEQAAAILRDEPRSAPVQLAHGIALRHLDKPDDALAAYARADEAAQGRLPEVHLARGVLLMRVKSECGPAITEFRAYADAVGPTAATDSPVLKLQRECEQMLEENRKAAEAAREMQRKAEQKAAEEAARRAGSGPAAPGPAGEGTAKTPAPTPAR